MSTNDLLIAAIKELESLEKGDMFLVKELFKGHEWNRIKKSDRLRLGILFLNKIKSEPSLGIEVLVKTSSNQQKYKKS
jgi:hypothetical protein